VATCSFNQSEEALASPKNSSALSWLINFLPHDRVTSCAPPAGFTRGHTNYEWSTLACQIACEQSTQSGYLPMSQRNGRHTLLAIMAVALMSSYLCP
jgi:hypothetical protein